MKLLQKTRCRLTLASCIFLTINLDKVYDDFIIKNKSDYRSYEPTL